MSARVLSVLSAAAVLQAAAAPFARVSTEDLTLPTYAYGEPDPVPATEKTRYPYCFFDGSSVTSSPRVWHAVVLENDRVKLTVMPELGGKVWGAVDKLTGREFIYFNHAVKFRNIAMRGPWCSGGIELNFGIVGHSPTTVAPVDWCVRTNADASVSCFLADDERICGTSWQVEVRLKPGEEKFETRTTWHNGSGASAPYYQWMTAAFTARGNPEFVYPGANWVGHDGSAHPWPRDGDGHDLSTYAGNDFGEAKSYHVVSGANGLFGIWWPEAKFGTIHSNHVSSKYGRKIFLWSHARDGGIWEDLLTDADGQYAELQSGRCFNQQTDGSELTPWKNPAFAPGATDTFEEEWGVVRDRSAFDAWQRPEMQVKRPLKTPDDFDWTSAYGLCLKGEQFLNRKRYAEAERAYRAALEKDRHYAPASAALADLLVRRGLFAEAHAFAERALAIDTYDARANFADGRAYLAEGDLPAAKERLGLAAWSPFYRAEAYVLVAKAELRERRLEETVRMADKALAANALSREAWFVKIVACRLKGETARAVRLAEEILAKWPLFHAVRHELARLERRTVDWTEWMRSESPDESWMAIGDGYESVGLFDDAADAFARAVTFSRPAGSANVEAVARAAYAREMAGVGPAAEPVADCLSVRGAFPFRLSSLPALKRMAERTSSWKFSYLEAVLLASLGRDAEADALLAACADVPDEEVFYLYRAKRREGAARLADLDRALACRPTWRTGLARYGFFAEAKDWTKARAALEPFAAALVDVDAFKIAWARALAESGACREAVDFLRRTTVLPSEFGDNAYGAWKLAWRKLAEEAKARGDAAAEREAVAALESYPENLGVGRPYPKE